MLGDLEDIAGIRIVKIEIGRMRRMLINESLNVSH
jgi:hypothetical protein